MGCLKGKRLWRLKSSEWATIMLDPNNEQSLLNYAFKLGHEAFKQRLHYSENPFNDWQRSDKWDEGWSAAEAENPGEFDFERDIFVFKLPLIEGNPDCPF